MLTITIDRELDEPVYEQVARQIRRLITAGSLSAGAALPAVRTLASDLSVNLNTVARAYRMLEREGFLKIRERAGVTVAAPAKKMDRSTRDALLSEIQILLSRLRQAGMSADELLETVRRELLAFEKGRRDGNE